jgi:recombination protein RecT
MKFMNTETQALEKKDTKAFTIREHLEGDSFKEALRQALPKILTPERFARVALTAITRTPKLKNCDQATFFNAMLTLAQLGIEPDGRRAHLIPFENKRRGCVECQLIIDYKGLAELAYRSGMVSNLHADVVCEHDEFEYDRGQLTKHKPNLKGERGEPYAVYALCRFRDGSEKCEVMTKAEVEAVRKRSRAGQSGPWVTDWQEMAKKTVFRRLSKWLPLSAEVREAFDKDDDRFDELQSRPVALNEPRVPFELTEAATEEVQQEPAEA